MTFGEAIATMKAGKRVSRDGWNGKGMYLYIAITTLPYPPLENGEWKYGTFAGSMLIIMKTADSKLSPWLASQTDVLAEDWGIVESK